MDLLWSILWLLTILCLIVVLPLSIASRRRSAKEVNDVQRAVRQDLHRLEELLLNKG